MRPGGRLLVAGGCLSLLASALHIACIVGGPDWYRFFGAGEPMARAAARGSMVPAAMTAAIAAVLALWAAYAFSGAGRIGRLPLLRTGLVTISAIYLARGLAVLHPRALGPDDVAANFMIWSSVIVLAYGLTYAIGTACAWPTLSRKELA